MRFSVHKYTNPDFYFQMKKECAERLGNSRLNASRRSSIRVVTGALAGKRTSRQASKAAKHNISKAVDKMNNLGKKLRRPTMQGPNGTVTFVTNGSKDLISDESTEEDTQEVHEVEETKEEVNEVPEVKVGLL